MLSCHAWSVLQVPNCELLGSFTFGVLLLLYPLLGPEHLGLKVKGVFRIHVEEMLIPLHSTAICEQMLWQRELQRFLLLT